MAVTIENPAGAKTIRPFTTSPAKAATSPPGNSRRSSPKRSAQAYGHYANNDPA
jgi:hypothetical protein